MLIEILSCVSCLRSDMHPSRWLICTCSCQKFPGVISSQHLLAKGNAHDQDGSCRCPLMQLSISLRHVVCRLGMPWNVHRITYLLCLA